MCETQNFVSWLPQRSYIWPQTNDYMEIGIKKNHLSYCITIIVTISYS